jgi:hypothetical protein
MRTLELTAGLHFPLQSDEGPHRHAAPADRTSPLQVRLRSAQRLLAESDSPAGSDDSVHGTTRRIVGEGFAIDAGRIRADRKWKPSSSGRGIRLRMWSDLVGGWGTALAAACSSLRSPTACGRSVSGRRGARRRRLFCGGRLGPFRGQPEAHCRYDIQADHCAQRTAGRVPCPR